MTTTTIPATTTTKDLQERTYTNLQYALWDKGFAKDLAHFLGSENAAAAFIAEIFNQARSKPQLHHCTIGSIRLNVAKVAALRLNPALPNMVQFIPRSLKQKDDRGNDLKDKGKDVWALELTMQYGYAGLRELVTRHPEVRDCFTREVCVNDYYESPATLISPPIHRKPPRFQPRGRVEGYFATIELTNGHWRTLEMSVNDVLEHAKQYVTQPGPAWQFKKGKDGAIDYKRPDVEDGLTTFDKMALKTVLRMHCNGRDVPLTHEVAMALQEDEEAIRTPTAAEYQGYDRQGNRPAITASTGVSLDELLQDTYGTRDKAAVEREMAYATRGQPSPQTDAVIEMDPETGEVRGEEPATTVDSRTGKVTGRGPVRSQPSIPFDAAVSARIDAEEEAARLAREQGLEH